MGVGGRNENVISEPAIPRQRHNALGREREQIAADNGNSQLISLENQCRGVKWIVDTGGWSRPCGIPTHWKPDRRRDLDASDAGGEVASRCDDCDLNGEQYR